LKAESRHEVSVVRYRSLYQLFELLEDFATRDNRSDAPEEDIDPLRDFHERSLRGVPKEIPCPLPDPAHFGFALCAEKSSLSKTFDIVGCNRVNSWVPALFDLLTRALNDLAQVFIEPVVVITTNVF
jgi:hypothetical protein